MSYITLNGPSYQSLPGGTGSTTVLSGQYIVSDASSHVITDASAGMFVAPFIARAYADASGTVGVLQQTTVEIIDIDEKFDITLSEADAKKILGAFQVFDTDASGGVSFDPSANVQVVMIDASSAGFKEALATALKSSSLVNAGSMSLTNWLKSETQADVTRLLNFDTLANLLEASVLKSFDIALDASGGADNMWTELDASGDEASARRRAMFTQLTESRVEKYAFVDPSGLDVSNERVVAMNFLPLVKGDKLAFVFDVIVGQYTAGSNTAPTIGSLITRTLADVAPGTTGSYAGDSYIIGGQVSSEFSTGNIAISKPTLRRVAVQLKMAGETGVGEPFAVTKSGDIVNGQILTLA